MNKNRKTEFSEMEVAIKVREACICAAKEGFKDASMSGLCTDGAMEAAVGAIQSLDLGKVIQKTEQ